MLDTSCTGSFMKKTIEFRRDILERIKHNSEDWELDEGKESGIKVKYDCVKSFMDMDAFQKFSTKHGLDSEIVASFCESFATHVDLPKEKWFKYHPPIKEETKEPVIAKDETIIYNVDPVVPTAYIEKPPFPVKIKEHAKVSTVLRRSNIKAPKPPEQIKAEPSVAMVKDLLVYNIDGHVIYFVGEATRIAKPDGKDKHRPVVGMPVVSVKIGDHCYHGLCDIGASVSAIPFTLYQEIMKDIAPAEIEDIDVTIKLANRDTITPLGIVRDVEVLCRKIKYPTDFLVLGSQQDNFCPIIFGRPFLNTVNAEIDCVKEKVRVKFGDVSHEFNFSNINRQPHERDCLVKMKVLVLVLLMFLLP